MDTTFPFGLPTATTVYLCLYLATFVIHLALMSYVLAGSGYLAVSAILKPLSGALFRRQQPLKTDAVATTLIDWLPFALGLAITAGVAPLLFVQILYREPFYTANLLLFHRWMALVPVLIAGFYMLYLNKSNHVQSWPSWARTALVVANFACFLFAAWSWTGNHTLSQADQQQWIRLYELESAPGITAAMLYRLGFWIASAIPWLATLVSWQIGPDHAAVRRRLAPLALASLGLALIFGWAYVTATHTESTVVAALAYPYTLAGAVGVALQIVGWLLCIRNSARRTFVLAMISVGATITTVAVAVIREAIRLNHFAAHSQLSALFAHHERAAASGGFTAFAISTVIVTGIIAWFLTDVRRHLRSASPQ